MPQRTLHQIAALILCSMPVAYAQNAPAKQGTQVLGEPGAASAIELLATRVESVEWDESTFAEVIDWLRDAGEQRINVVPRWQALATENVRPDSPISLRLVETTVADVLKEVLDELSLEDALGYQAERNYVRISTREDFNRKMYARAYYIADIVLPVPDFGSSAPLIDLEKIGRHGRYSYDRAEGGGGSGVNWRGRGGRDGDGADPYDELGKLVVLIQMMIEPDSWSTGPSRGRGRIEAVGRTLIVYNTIEVHEQIAGYFDYSE